MADHIPRISYGSGPTLIQFIYPPEGDPSGESVSSIGAMSIAANGQIQNNHRYTQREFRVKVGFISETLKAAFDAFFKAHGCFKKSFTYYPNTDVNTNSITCTLMDDKIDYSRDLPASDGFLYSFAFNLRTVE